MEGSFPSIVEDGRAQRDHVAETPDLIISLAQPGLPAGLLEREEMRRRGRRRKGPSGSGHKPDGFAKGQLCTPPSPLLHKNKITLANSLDTDRISYK